MQKINSQSVMIIEPGPDLAEICRKKGFQVVGEFLENVSANELPNGQNCFVSFELFEHLHNPSEFLYSLKALMDSGDLFIFTTLSGAGVDIQALWQDSKSVSPPHHLNFLNPHAVRLLLNRVGLEPLNITTPGKLDIDIMSNNYNQISEQ